MCFIPPPRLFTIFQYNGQRPRQVLVSNVRYVFLNVPVELAFVTLVMYYYIVIGEITYQ